MWTYTQTSDSARPISDSTQLKNNYHFDFPSFSTILRYYFVVTRVEQNTTISLSGSTYFNCFSSMASYPKPKGPLTATIFFD